MKLDSLTDARILMVDDARANILALEATLEQAGYTQLHSTTKPREVMDLFRELRPDLVLLDLHMPELDGFELLHLLRAEILPGTYLPILVLTADVTGPAKQRALSAGANDFLTKPFEPAEIRLRVRHLLETRQLYLQLQEQNRVLDERVRERTRDLEAAQQQLLDAEEEKKRFYREVIRAVTEDKLHLVEASEIPIEGRHVLHLSLDAPEQYRQLRQTLTALGEEMGMPGERLDDLVLGAGEAATNAIKHGERGYCDVYVIPEGLCVRIGDYGAGIMTDKLPASLLVPGFSTKVSLGMGFTMMLRLVDCLWLATGPEGTVVQMEKSVRAEEPILGLPLLAGVTADDDDW